jgi:hypothetical protein
VSCAPAHAGIVLLLTRQADADPWRLLRQRIAALLPVGAPLAVLDLGELRAAPQQLGPLRRLELEQKLANAMLAAVQGRTLPPRGRALITVVGILEDATSRLSASALLPALHGSLRRVAAATDMEPLVKALWSLPTSWSAREAAELFHWTASLAGTLRNGGPRYASNVMTGAWLGEPGRASGTRCLTRIEQVESNAQLIHALYSTDLAGRLLDASRGRGPGAALLALGLQPTLPREALWPCSMDAHVRGPERIQLTPLRPQDYSGAVEANIYTRVALPALHGFAAWRDHYLSLSDEEKLALGGVIADPHRACDIEPELEERVFETVPEL